MPIERWLRIAISQKISSGSSNDGSGGWSFRTSPMVRRACEGLLVLWFLTLWMKTRRAARKKAVGSEDDILREAFGVFDTDKDGLIAASEIGTVIRALGTTLYGPFQV